MESYKDIWWKSHDGLNLYARDYQHADSARLLSPSVHEGERPPTIVCIHGLTRNSADFAQLCDHLAQGYRVVAVDVRGRGRSDCDPNPMNYHPATYAEDMLALFDKLGLGKVILIGTSMGGLISMLVATQQPQRVGAIVLNDIGPEVHAPGLERIKEYVAEPNTVANWDEAAKALSASHQREYPDFVEEDWALFARNLYREGDDGRPILNYDPNIAVPMQAMGDTPSPDLWAVFDYLKNIPLLVVRGEYSDILTRECVEAMRNQHPRCCAVEVAHRGHAPLLTEPRAVNAIEHFLEAVTQSPSAAT